MTDKTIKKLFVLLLLFNIVMAAAFSLLLPSKPVKISTESNIQSDKQTPEAHGQSAESPDIQKSHLEIRTATVSQPMEPLPESGDEILSSATNEDEALDELRALARKDPEAALTWGQQQTNSAERNEALTDACFQIAQADPMRAVGLAQQFNLNKDTVLQNLAQQWAAKDLTTAYNWIVAQPAGDQRDALATGMAFIWSQTEPVSAEQFVIQQMAPGSAQDEAVMMVLHQWALVDLTGASAWVQQFPENPLRKRALDELSGIARYKQGIAQSQ
jgi:hypothetical protein